MSEKSPPQPPLEPPNPFNIFFNADLQVKGMAKCQSCHHGINSTYIREGVRGSFRKIGYYCNTCNIHYTWTNLASNSIISQNQNILSNDHGYTNNYNKINEKMQYLHG